MPLRCLRGGSSFVVTSSSTSRTAALPSPPSPFLLPGDPRLLPVQGRQRGHHGALEALPGTQGADSRGGVSPRDLPDRSPADMGRRWL